MSTRSTELAIALNAQRHAFKSFIVARVGNEAAAEDILQNGLLKALQRGEEIRDDDRLTAWFYRLLRNAITDHYRSSAASRRRDDVLGTTLAALGADVASATPPDWDAQICGCLGSVIDTLKPNQAALLRRVDLQGESVQNAAGALGLSANNASVTLYRARQELREKLQAFCGACADGACLDCECQPTDAKP